MVKPKQDGLDLDHLEQQAKSWNHHFHAATESTAEMPLSVATKVAEVIPPMPPASTSSATPPTTTTMASTTLESVQDASAEGDADLTGTTAVVAAAETATTMTSSTTTTLESAPETSVSVATHAS